MKKLMKKILTNKKARNLGMLSLFLLTVAKVGSPWFS
jgi:hypothetical protein